MAESTIVKKKLCKFREQDWWNVEAIQAREGFHEAITAIRFALNREASRPAKKTLRKSRSTT